MWQSRDFRSVPLVAQLLFVCLINHADDEGRLKTDAEHISDTMLKILVPEIQQALDALVERRMVVQYKAGGETYIALTNWDRHQKISHRNASTYPAPPTKRIPERSGKIRNIPVSRAPADPDPDPDQTPIPSPPADAVRLCDSLAAAIEGNGSKRPTITQEWLTEADRLLRLDKRPVDDALDLIAWCQRDAFWKANILSLPKFREKYDQLRLARERGSKAPVQEPGSIAAYLARKGASA